MWTRRMPLESSNESNPAALKQSSGLDWINHQQEGNELTVKDAGSLSFSVFRSLFSLFPPD